MPPEEDPDTIIVKGEQQWSHPSTPSSTTSFIGPPSINLPTQSTIPQHLESPEPLEDDVPSRPEAHQNSGTSRRYKKESATMEERLQSMPEKRTLPWRPGVEAGAEQETGGESRRKQIRFGCLLATRGDVADPPCLSCANGRGKFALCVALEGYFKGACASCQLSGRPNRCSIKLGEDPTQSPPNVETPGTEQLPNIQQRPSPAVLASTSSGPPPAKRKRTSTNPGGIPEWEHSRPQWEQELGDAHARQPMANEVGHHLSRPLSHPQAQVQTQAQAQVQAQQAQAQQAQAQQAQAQAQAQGQGPMMHHHHMHGQQPPSQHVQQPQMQQGQRPWPTVNAPAPPQPTQMIQQHNGPPMPRTSSGGWAAVNQPPTRPEPRRIYSADGNGIEMNNNTNSMNGGTGVGPRMGPRISLENGVNIGNNGNGISGVIGNQNGIRRSMDQGHREDTAYEEGNAPMIDMLPKSKQRQVYGLISGLQGGIEHLQRELAALKQALGIDDED